MNENQSVTSSSAVARTLYWILILVVLVHLPLMAAAVEYFLFRSGHVEALCRQIGVGGILGRIYEPALRLFGF
jgi:hypothetical protein